MTGAGFRPRPRWASPVPRRGSYTCRSSSQVCTRKSLAIGWNMDLMDSRSDMDTSSMDTSNYWYWKIIINYHPSIIQLSSDYHPIIIQLSSNYHQLSSNYHQLSSIIIQLSSNDHPIIINYHPTISRSDWYCIALGLDPPRLFSKRLSCLLRTCSIARMNGLTDVGSARGVDSW